MKFDEMNRKKTNGVCFFASLRTLTWEQLPQVSAFSAGAVPAQASVIAEGEGWLHLCPREAQGGTPQPHSQQLQLIPGRLHLFLGFWTQQLVDHQLANLMDFSSQQQQYLLCETINQTTKQSQFFVFPPQNVRPPPASSPGRFSTSKWMRISSGRWSPPRGVLILLKA